MILPETWQDWVLMIGNLIFFLALLPSIFSKDKPNVWTSGPTSAVLSAITVTYWSLGLKFGSVMLGLSALAWCVLFFQKIFHRTP